MSKTLLIFIVLAYVFVTECRWDRIKVQSPSGYCTFKTYVPGGNRVTLKKITAPTAKLQGGIMATIMGKTGQAAMLGMHTSNLAKGLEKFGKTFLKLAPKLGPALGIFGTVLGGVAGFLSPSPADILKAANKAIEKLTNEVNDRLEDMRGYVDQKVIDLEKSIMQDDFQVAANLWGNCIREISEGEVNECQKDAVRLIIATKPKFMINDVDNNDVFKVKRMEATLMSFRDYALLLILSLKTLCDTYKDKTDANSQKYYERYRGELKAEVKSLVDYAKAAVIKMRAMHSGSDGYGSCMRTFKCNGMHDIKEGWFIKKNTADWTECSCVFDPADVGTRTCKRHITVRVDGKRVGYPYISIWTRGNSHYAAAQEYGKTLMKKVAKQYLDKMGDTIKRYWSNNVLDLLPIWEDMAESVESGARKREIHEMNKRIMKDEGFSKNFQRRLKAAKEACKKNRE